MKAKNPAELFMLLFFIVLTWSYIMADVKLSIRDLDAAPSPAWVVVQ